MSTLHSQIHLSSMFINCVYKKIQKILPRDQWWNLTKTLEGVTNKIKKLEDGSLTSTKYYADINTLRIRDMKEVPSSDNALSAASLRMNST